MKSIKYLFVAILLIFMNCTNKDFKINDNYLYAISNEEYDGFLIIKFDKNDLRVVNNLVFKNTIYEQYYKNHYSTYYAFLKAIYEQKLNDLYKVSKSEETLNERYFYILKEYNDKGINYIKNEYLIKKDDKNYTFKNKTELAIFEIMFYNEYYIYFDDYTGEYTFSLDYYTTPTLDLKDV